MKLIQKFCLDQNIQQAEKIAKRRCYFLEQIITKLCEAAVYLSQGKTVWQACKSMEICEQTCYLWRREYGGMDVTQVISKEYL